MTGLTRAYVPVCILARVWVRVSKPTVY